MSGVADQRTAELDPDGVVGPPKTGEAAVDDALRGLTELGSTPLPEHHERLAWAHESLHDALHTDTANGPTSRR